MEVDVEELTALRQVREIRRVYLGHMANGT
jgi:hypothetical protein